MSIDCQLYSDAYVNCQKKKKIVYRKKPSKNKKKTIKILSVGWLTANTKIVANHRINKWWPYQKCNAYHKNCGTPHRNRCASHKNCESSHKNCESSHKNYESPHKNGESSHKNCESPHKKIMFMVHKSKDSWPMITKLVLLIVHMRTIRNICLNIELLEYKFYEETHKKSCEL